MPLGIKSFFKRSTQDAVERIIRKPPERLFPQLCPELTPEEVRMLSWVTRNIGSKVTPQGLINTLMACKYVEQKGVAGAFVECGVWRGANSVLAKMVFESLGSSRKVYMYDTFRGMNEPEDVDVAALSQEPAKNRFFSTLRETHSPWAYAPLEVVREACRDAAINMEEIEFVVGPCEETLRSEENLPEDISVLRLDTDWYLSTKVELEILYPRLARGGCLIVDDYGHWEGARKAVDEYFAERERPFFHVTDYTCRTAIRL